MLDSSYKGAREFEPCKLQEQLWAVLKYTHPISIRPLGLLAVFPYDCCILGVFDFRECCSSPCLTRFLHGQYPLSQAMQNYLVFSVWLFRLLFLWFIHAVFTFRVSFLVYKDQSVSSRMEHRKVWWMLSLFRSNLPLPFSRQRIGSG